jgi:hypothetical protein
MEYRELSGNLLARAGNGATAAATALQVPIMRCAYKIKVVGAYWIPGAAMTANDTNFVTLTIRNRLAVDGSGTTTLATRVYNVAGGNGVAGKAEALTLTTTAADLLAEVGDVLTAQWTHTASGLAIPAGLVELVYQLR